jgi:hypothetical protein
LLAHLPFLDMPPRDVHAWRQSHTLAVARNFYEESFNIFETRVDNRYETDGVTGSHFPAFEWLLAAIYYLTGSETFWKARLWCLLLHYWGVWGMFRLIFFITDRKIVAGFAGWMYLWAPELFYYAICPIPDNLALPASIWGIYFLFKAFERGAYVDYFLATVLITLAGLTKIQFLAVGFPAVVAIISGLFYRRLLPQNWSLPNQLRSIKGWLLILATGITAVIVPLLWYGYAIEMIRKSKLTDFGIEFRPAGNLWEGLKTLKKNIISDMPGAILGFGTMFLLLSGLYYGYVKPAKRSGFWLPALVVWAGALCVYHIIELKQMHDHGYYMMPYYPVLLLIAGFGAWRWLYHPSNWLIYTIVLLMPILCIIPIYRARWLNVNPRVPIELYQSQSRQRLQQAVAPFTGKVIVGPDPSGCIYFYYLRTKGFGFWSREAFSDSNGDSLGFKRMRYWCWKGAELLVTDDTIIATDTLVRQYFPVQVLREGRFWVLGRAITKAQN